MRVLFLSGELIAGDLPYRLREEGCDVKLYVEHPNQKDSQSGFVPRIDDWRIELDWVGRTGLIVFDDVGFGEIQDKLRRDGFRVFGGSLGGDRLELDREFAQQVFAGLGIEVLPTLRFEHPIEAAKHIRSSKACRWVAKPNNHDSSLCYVGLLDDGSDVVEVLESYQASGIRDISLQKAADGIELAVERYFNGRDWVRPVQLNVEHKSLCDGDIGPKTGEMGNLTWYVDDEDQRLFRTVLEPLKPYLAACDFRGDVDVNCLVNKQHVVPIEVAARIGCPSIHIQESLHRTPWRELLGVIADGRKINLDYRLGYGIGLTVAVPPFPYQGQVADRYSAAGFPVRFRTEPSLEERRRHYHFESVRREIGVDGRERLHVTNGLGYAAFVTGVGDTVHAAREDTYAAVRNLCIPKAIYRTDIGRKFVETDAMKLKSWGWI
jgi:phosphoribosylamine--glycine ligase